MPIRGELWLSPVCGRGHHDDCQAGDNGCECSCHRGDEPEAEPTSNGTGGFAVPDVRRAVEEMRAELPDTPAPFSPSEMVPCRVGCGKTFKARSGESIHFKYQHNDEVRVDAKPLDPNIGRIERGQYRCTVCLAATFETQRGVEVHYARCHGPNAIEKTDVPEGLPPASPRAVPPAPAPAPGRPPGPASRTIAPEKQEFIAHLRAARDELADEEQTAERDLARLRTAIVALDGLLDSYS